MYMESLQDARAEEVRLFVLRGEGHPALACVSIGSRDLAAAPGAEERRERKDLMVTINGKQEQAAGMSILAYLQSAGYSPDKVVVEETLRSYPGQAGGSGAGGW